MSTKISKISLKNLKSHLRVLREQAEPIAQKKTLTLNNDLSDEKIQELILELQIHQIELEMQNEELHQRKAELSAERERYFDLYELAPVGYFTLSTEGKILQANLTATILLSTPKSALIHNFFNKFIAYEDQDIAYLHFKNLLLTYTSQSFELQMMRGDGTKFWAQVDVSHSQNSKSTRTLRLVINDITERKNIQRDLAIAAIAFESQNGIVITDAKGTILRVNQAFTRITGYTAQEAIGQSVTILKSGRHGEQFYARLWLTLSTQGRWQGEIWNRRKNGDVYAELLSITQVTDTTSGVTHYVGNFSDITEEKEAEAPI
jgi:PAS domain S-box-containing protein